MEGLVFWKNEFHMLIKYNCDNDKYYWYQKMVAEFHPSTNEATVSDMLNSPQSKWGFHGPKKPTK